MTKEEFFKIKTMNCQNPSLNSFLILEAAEKRKLKIEYIAETDYFLISDGKRLRTLRIDHNHLGMADHARRILNDKNQTKIFLSMNNVMVPKGYRVNINDDDQLKKLFTSLNKPVIIKPAANTSGGLGVITSISNFDQLYNAITHLRQENFQEIVLEEQFIGGQEYRIFATREKMVAVTLRVPANIVGDGKHTISELIEMKNNDPQRGDHGYQKPLLKIEVDKFVEEHLKKQGLTVNSIPKEREQIFLREISNLSAGGDSIDFTDQVHPSIKEIAIRAICSVPELPYAGIDLITKDITAKQDKDTYVIIEMNGAPMISMHHFPFQGKSRDAAGEIININFPNHA